MFVCASDAPTDHKRISLPIFKSSVVSYASFSLNLRGQREHSVQDVDSDNIIKKALTASACLERVDWTGRAILENKRGHIPKDHPPVLERLQTDPKHCPWNTH